MAVIHLVWQESCSLVFSKHLELRRVSIKWRVILWDHRGLNCAARGIKVALRVLSQTVLPLGAASPASAKQITPPEQRTQTASSTVLRAVPTAMLKPRTVTEKSTQSGSLSRRHC